MPKIWHYTTGTSFVEIADSGFLRGARARVFGTERRAVWFSTRTDWEPTATKLHVNRHRKVRVATLDEMVARGGPLTRIEVGASVAPYTWKEHRRIGRIDIREADALERYPGAVPTDWRLSYQDVKIADFLSVEASKDGRQWECVGLRSEQGLCLTEEFVAACYEAFRRTRPATAP